VEIVTSYAPARSERRLSRDVAVVDGPRYYRSRIRVRGPFVALIAPAIVGVVAFGALQLFETAWSGAVGLVGGVLAAPTLLFVGAPFGDRDIYPFAVVASAPLWMLVGWIAAVRATRNPMASWVDFWKHLVPLTIGIWTGACVAMVLATLSIGDTLF
jgi:hypothetical protein